LEFRQTNEKGYKQTEIGLIPEDWEVKTLGDVSVRIASGTSKTDTDTNGEYPIFGSTGIIGYKEEYDYYGNRILVARVGANAGVVNCVDGKYCVSENTLIVQLRDVVNFYLFIIS
jgi:type I restriction enzyme S subunit